MGDMECKATEQYVTVWLRGGPWDGFEVLDVFDHAEIYGLPVADLGARMPVPGDPEASHRALYEPTDDDRTLWRFVGWE